jgi:hypothetical protein
MAQHWTVGAEVGLWLDCGWTVVFWPCGTFGENLAERDKGTRGVRRTRDPQKLQSPVSHTTV